MYALLSSWSVELTLSYLVIGDSPVSIKLVLNIRQGCGPAGEVDQAWFGNGCHVDDLAGRECAPRNIILVLGLNEGSRSWLGSERSNWDNVRRVRRVLGP